MRATLRLLASVKPVAPKYLEPFAPTGLTGLRTNPSPRSTLLYLYATTLDKLAAGVPETSAYRQSVEAVTRHRMALVEAVRPEGYDEWRARAAALLDKHPGRLSGGVRRRLDDGTTAAGVDRAGRFFVLRQLRRDVDIRYEEWDREKEMGEPLEGSRTEAERKTEYTAEKPFEDDGLEWEDEPQLTAAQISDLENNIGAGLIEEVIQVAEGELKLVDTMVQVKAWESLEEKPREGQWTYFERKE